MTTSEARKRRENKMRFRKKPVEVLAWDVGTILLAHREAGIEALPNPVIEGTRNGQIAIEDDHIVIVTLEGAVVGRDGDMLIQGVQGEFYPCKRDIFNQTYEQCS